MSFRCRIQLESIQEYQSIRRYCQSPVGLQAGPCLGHSRRTCGFPPNPSSVTLGRCRTSRDTCHRQTTFVLWEDPFLSQAYRHKHGSCCRADKDGILAGEDLAALGSLAKPGVSCPWWRRIFCVEQCNSQRPEAGLSSQTNLNPQTFFGQGLLGVGFLSGL